MNKISIEEWHKLPDDKKEMIREWTVKNNFGLDITPSKTAATCDYAALLSVEQLQQLLTELRKKHGTPNGKLLTDCSTLLHEITQLLSSNDSTKP